MNLNPPAKARISPRDIGHVSPGQPVKVKVSAFDFARYGEISGSLSSVSATTFLTDAGEAFYRGRVVLDKNYVGGDASRNLIVPGMTVEADIITGSKTILDYPLKPIQVSLNTAFTER